MFVFTMVVGCYRTGQVWSWGDGDYGKLGRGGSDGCKTPKLVEKLQDLDIVKVCCGSQFSLALSKDGQVYTWGKGDNQRLGHGTDEHVRYPKLLDSLQGEPKMRPFVWRLVDWRCPTWSPCPAGFRCHLPRHTPPKGLGRTPTFYNIQTKTNPPLLYL